MRVLPDDSGDPIVAVVIPAYNEAKWIGRVLDGLPRDPRFEAIVVDDGSDDGTADEARAHGAAVVLRWERQRGVGAAIRAGWRCGIERGRPLLALIGGDHQHDGADLVPALETLLASRADYVQGSRFKSGGAIVGATRTRRVTMTLYSALVSALAGQRTTDASNGFRLLRAEVLADPAIQLDQDWLDGYSLEPYLLYKVLRRHRVVEVPVLVRFHGPPTSIPAPRARVDPPHGAGRAARDAGEALTRVRGEAVRRPPGAGHGRRGLRRRRRRRSGSPPAARTSPSSTTSRPGGRDAVPPGSTVVRVLDRRPGRGPRRSSPSIPWIFHLAARSIAASTRNPREDLETNAAGTLNLLLAARECQRRAARLRIVGIDLRQRPHAPDQRGRPRRRALAVRRQQAHRRAVLPRVPPEPRRAGRDRALLERLRPAVSAPTTRTPASWRSSSPPPRRAGRCAIHGDGAADPRLHLRRRRRRRHAGRRHAPRRRGRGVQRRHRHRDVACCELARAIALAVNVEPAVEHVDRRDIDNIRAAGGSTSRRSAACCSGHRRSRSRRGCDAPPRRSCR